MTLDTARNIDNNCERAVSKRVYESQSFATVFRRRKRRAGYCQINSGRSLGSLVRERNKYTFLARGECNVSEGERLCGRSEGRRRAEKEACVVIDTGQLFFGARTHDAPV